MLDAIKQWILKILGMNISEDPANPLKRSDSSEIKNEIVKQLLVDHGFTSRQINEYFTKMSSSVVQKIPIMCTFYDPRELPRPRKHVRKVYIGSSNRNSEENLVMSCACYNCIQLITNFTECGICLEPISGQMLASCRQCGNFACGTCATKLARCPFCRSHSGLAKNLALQRFVNKLEMPCSNLKVNEKLNEAVLCLHKNCIWTGSINNLAKHLADSHTCIVIEGSFVSLIIAEFKNKAKATITKPRNYCLVLTSAVHLYVCKIILTGTKLEFIVLGRSKTQLHNFGLTVEVSCNKRKIKGVIPFSKKRAYVSLCTRSLLYKCRKKSDSLMISLTAESLS